MISPLAWPALQLSSLPAKLTCEHGIWGKVHGAPSDFRWIARSPGFGRNITALEREFGLGSEDSPRQASFWRALGNEHFAIISYPSRSIDAAGRSGFLEKQILQWQHGSDIPAALGALLLLPQVSQLTDAIWWKDYKDKPWSQPNFSLPLVVAELTCTEEHLSQIIEQGISALKAVLDEETLQRCYVQMLSKRQPVQVGLQEPLSPEALAVLLLPLPREIADRLSLAGWIPSRRYSIEELGKRWDMLVLPEKSSSVIEPDIEPEAMEQALRMVRALFSADPSRLVSSTDLEPQVSVGLSSAEPEPGEAAQLANLYEPGQLVRPGLEIGITDPGPEAPPFINSIYAFAKAVDRRWLWLDPDNCPIALSPLRSKTLAGQALCKWALELEEHRPDYVDPQQWQVKVDLLRALALVLVPTPTTLEKVGLLKSARVPALLYMDLLENWDFLAGLGGDLRTVIEQSLSCTFKQAQIRDALSEWRDKTKDNGLKEVLKDTLAISEKDST